MEHNKQNLCVLCGKETTHYVARTAPLRGFGLVLRNSNGEELAKTTEILDIEGGTSILVMYFCNEHTCNISYEHLGI